MPETYAVLRGKYQRALVSIRELEQEKENQEKHISTIEKEHKRLEKAVEQLCLTILKKEPDIRSDEDDLKREEKPWFQMPLIEQVARSQENLEKYLVTWTGIIQSLKDRDTQREQEFELYKEETKKNFKEKIESYAGQIRERDEIIQKLQSSSTLKKDEIQKIVDDAQKPLVDLDMTYPDNIGFEPEEKDEIGTDVAQAAEIFHESGEIFVEPKKGPEIRASVEMEHKLKEQIGSIAEDSGTKLEELVQQLNNVQKIVIRTFGETGYSEAEPIYQYIEENYPDSVARSKTKLRYELLKLLKGEDGAPVLIEGVKCPVPGITNIQFYRLNQDGISAYRYMFNREPQEPEMDAIKRNHTTLEHGYGIRQTARLLNDSAFLKKANTEAVYMTRTKEYTVKTGENSSYIPDIVIPLNGKKPIYIEYETGKCHEFDFFEKCNKIASFSGYINIVVPNNNALKIVLERVEKWKEKVYDGTFSLKRPVRVQLNTYETLKTNCTENRIIWQNSKTITPSQKGKEAAGHDV